MGYIFAVRLIWGALYILGGYFMKNIFKKIIATFLVVLMLISSVPLQGLVGVDFKRLFSTEANAAVNNENLPVYTTEEKKLFESLGFDPFSVFKGIDLGEAEIELPSVTILGKEYSMGSLSGGIKIPLDINISYKVDFEKKNNTNYSRI